MLFDVIKSPFGDIPKERIQRKQPFFFFYKDIHSSMIYEWKNLEITQVMGRNKINYVTYIHRKMFKLSRVESVLVSGDILGEKEQPKSMYTVIIDM